LPGRIQDYRVLGGGKAVVTQSDRGISIAVVPAARGKIATVLQLTLDKRVFDFAPIAVDRLEGMEPDKQ
jgi:hypothetical protein